jgi:hypothetical protein
VDNFGRALLTRPVRSVPPCTLVEQAFAPGRFDMPLKVGEIIRIPERDG